MISNSTFVKLPEINDDADAVFDSNNQSTTMTTTTTSYQNRPKMVYVEKFSPSRMRPDLEKRDNLPCFTTPDRPVLSMANVLKSTKIYPNQKT